MFVEITYPEIILMLFTVSMIWIFILTELHKIMGKLNAVSAGMLFTIVVVTFLSNGLVIYDNLNETFGESFGMFSFGIVVILVAVSMVLSLDFITKSLDYIIRTAEDMHVQDGMVLHATASEKTGTIRLYKKELKDSTPVKIRQRLTKTYKNQRYHSTRITIPVHIVRELHLQKNDELDIDCRADTIIIKSRTKDKRRPRATY